MVFTGSQKTLLVPGDASIDGEYEVLLSIVSLFVVGSISKLSPWNILEPPLGN